jgi:HNH endonuclease
MARWTSTPSWRRSTPPARRAITAWSTTKLAVQSFAAHRASYRVFVGPIPARHHIDQVCRTRACVNAPGGHLEAVTQAENTRRAVAYVQRFPGERVHHGAKRWCIRGHAFDEANTGIDAQGKCHCKACRHEHLKIWLRPCDGCPLGLILHLVALDVACDVGRS